MFSKVIITKTNAFRYLSIKKRKSSGLQRKKKKKTQLASHF